MSLRLVRGGSSPTGGEAAGPAAAFLVVDRRGAVLDALGWETLSADPAPRRIGSGDDDNPFLRGIGEAVTEARANRRPAVRSLEVSLERVRTYAVAAAPLPGESKGGDVAVTVQEIPEAAAGRAEGKVIRQLGHDLRTPLTSISGAVELLQSGRLCPVQQPQERVLGMMQKGVDAMVRLIDEATAAFRNHLVGDAELDLLGELESLERKTEGKTPAGPRPVRSKRGRR